MGLLTLGVAVWSCVVYFDTSSECKDHFQDAYPRLWDCVTGEVIVFFIVLAFVGLVILGSIVYSICSGARDEKPATTVFNA